MIMKIGTQDNSLTSDQILNENTVSSPHSQDTNPANTGGMDTTQSVILHQPGDGRLNHRSPRSTRRI
jgi:hypothetical protein